MFLGLVVPYHGVSQVHAFDTLGVDLGERELVGTYRLGSDERCGCHPRPTIAFGYVSSRCDIFDNRPTSNWIKMDRNSAGHSTA